MSAAKRVVKVDFYNWYNLTALCFLSTELSRLWSLMLMSTSITNCILLRILHTWKGELIELNLTATHNPCANVYPKLCNLTNSNIFLPHQDITVLGRKAVVEIPERCQTLALACQKGYFLSIKFDSKFWQTLYNSVKKNHFIAFCFFETNLHQKRTFPKHLNFDYGTFGDLLLFL